MSWGMVGAAAVSVVGGYFANKDKGGGGGSSSSGGAYDPYAPYRAGAAERLNALMENPQQIQQLPEFDAAQQGAARVMAAQGYTGSGNALVAAAKASGDVYQQAFNNLAMLSGAGQSPASAASAADRQANYQQQAQNQMWGQLGNVAGRVIDHYTTSDSSLPPIDTGSIDISGDLQPTPGDYQISQPTYQIPPISF